MSYGYFEPPEDIANHLRAHRALLSIFGQYEKKLHFFIFSSYFDVKMKISKFAKNKQKKHKIHLVFDALLDVYDYQNYLLRKRIKFLSYFVCARDFARATHIARTPYKKYPQMEKFL